MKYPKTIFFGTFGAAAVLGSVAGCTLISDRMGTPPSAEECAAFEKLANYSGGRFRNREPIRIMIRKQPFPFAGLCRFLFRSEHAPKEGELKILPLTKHSFARKPGDGVIYFLGHSTLIFELDGMRFITDPVFGNAAPVSFAVRRYGPPPLPRNELPELDFILITHDHYDHLEYDTIRALRNWKGIFVTSLGVGSRLRGWGIPPERIHELNWGDSLQLGKIRISMRTSRHFSGRSLRDRDQTLWGSFIFETKTRKIFFGGDGGYGSHFKEIGEKDGPFDLACLEIDAWNAYWPDNHMFPQESVQAFHDLRAKQYMPIHYGVFDMAMHPWNDSLTMVRTLCQKQNVPLLAPVQGEKVLLPDAQEFKD